MLMLLFRIGGERYVCQCDQIVEIFPRVPVRSVIQAPAYVVGLFTYRGFPIPVIDFSMLVSGRQSNHFLSTRMILFQKEAFGGGAMYLGLIAERVTDTIESNPTEFLETGIELIDANFLGGILSDDKGLIHYILINKLFENAEKLLTGTLGCAFNRVCLGQS